MAGAAGARPNDATIKQSDEKMANWRRGEEGSVGQGRLERGEGQGRRWISFSALIFRAPDGIELNRAWAASPML